MDEDQNTNQDLGLKISAGLAVVLSLIVGILAYPHLPASVPSHWNSAGEIDGYTTALGGAFLLPLIMLGVFGLFLLLPRIDPKKMNYAKMGKAYWILGLGMILFFTMIYLSTLAVALGYVQTLSSKWIFSAVGILFILMGNYFGKIKHNYFLGIRTPWTLASEEVWTKTHRFAGPIWVVGGVLLLATGFLPSVWATAWLLGIVAIIAIVPMVYSYLLFRNLLNR